MTNEQFAALVQRLEDEARRNPDAYQLKVLALAWLGNAYLTAILILISALFAGLVVSVVMFKAAVAWKLVLVVGAFLWMVLKAVAFGIPEPEGLELDRAQAPALFEMIEALRRQLGAPAFDRVLMTNDFNAGVVQTPQLGIFGWYRNDLLLGLPLMKSLTAEQFKAVLAHEFGHLAKGHGRMSNWIYRQRLRWSRLIGVLEANQSQGRVFFKPFLDRFAPYFNAYSFPLARANEYEADAAAVRLTSPRAAAAALTGLSVLGSYLGERYWPQVYGQADDHPHPAIAPFAAMDRGLASELDEASCRRWQEQAMAVQTTLADTHPSLQDRLEAIGEGSRFAPPAQGEAADGLLGDARAAIVEHFDRGWKESIAATWTNRHQEVQDARRRLAELNARHASGAELSVGEAYERANLTGLTGKDAEGWLVQLQALHERAPDDAVIMFSLGDRLLARDDEAGRALVERAMQLDEDATVHACEALRDYHWRSGRKDEAEAWHRRLVERAQLQEAAAKERKDVTARDTFEAHGLPAAELARLQEQLRSVEGLVRAYLVRKRVVHLAHRPMYVLGYCVTRALWLHSGKRAAAVLQRIQEKVAFPGETLILNVESQNRRFARRFRQIEGARVI